MAVMKPFKREPGNSLSGLGASDKIKALLSKYLILLVFLGLCAVMSIASPAFARIDNLRNIVVQVSVIGVMSMGSTLILITAGVDLSPGAVVGLIGVVATSFSQTAVDPMQPISVVMPIVFSILIALAAGALIGLTNGAVTAFGRIPAFITTLGMMTVARGAALLLSKGRPIGHLKAAYVFMGGGDFLGIGMPIWIFLFFGIISHILLSRTRFGRYVYAIGGNVQAARLCGINVERTLLGVYAYASLLAAVAGILVTARTTAGNPVYGTGYELQAIAAAVIGGTSLMGGIGSIPLSIVGALIIGVMYNGMNLLGIDPYWQQIVQGMIIVGAVFIDVRKQRRV